jgi:predicted O-methyltransferase YrrM
VVRALTIEKALSVEGYMSEEELLYLAEAASKSKTIVEIGSWKGRSTCALAANTEGVVFCVDTWSGDLETNDKPNPDMFETFMRNTSEFRNVWPIRRTSQDAAKFILGLKVKPDMIFIDADHNLKPFTDDLIAWSQVLSDQGFLCGHDYGYDGWPAVKTVVDSMIPKFRLIGSIWTTEGC